MPLIFSFLDNPGPLVNELNLVDSETSSLHDNGKVELLLHDSSRFNKDQNHNILEQ